MSSATRTSNQRLWFIMPVWAVVMATTLLVTEQDMEVDSIGWFLLQGALLGVGTLILANRPGNRIGRIIFMAGTTFAAGVAMGLNLQLVEDFWDIRLIGLLAAVSAVLITIWVPVIAWALFLFPTGELPGPGWK